MSLPTRDGVSPSAVFLPEGDWPTLLAFLVARFPGVGEARWHARMASGSVVDASSQVLTPDAPYRKGIRIYYYRELEHELHVPFDEAILYQDDNIVVADKPHFLPTAPVGQYVKETLLVRLKQRLGIDHLVPLHRLDRETAGVLILSTNIATRDAHHALFRDNRISKTYEAIAPWNPAHAFPLTYSSRIDVAETFYRRQEVPGEPNAITMIDVMEQRNGLARYRLQPVTGKTHQLRVHMAALGMPILNDPYYPIETARKGDDFSLPLQLLARTLAFTDPVTGEERCFESLQQLCGM
ncbi:MAG: pseudouridine synthase [Moraxellaceae bacterium]|nr:pseudouridine synthase [Moraxellaceae bacterium]